MAKIEVRFRDVQCGDLVWMPQIGEYRSCTSGAREMPFTNTRVPNYEICVGRHHRFSGPGHLLVEVIRQ